VGGVALFEARVRKAFAVGLEAGRGDPGVGKSFSPQMMGVFAGLHLSGSWQSKSRESGLPAVGMQPERH
jgi:hypothetical protein